MSAWLVRPAAQADAAVLADLHAAVAGELLPPAVLAARLEPNSPGGGRYWLAFEDGRPVGYGAVHPTPGLPGLYDLEGGVLPERRRRGAGSRLLAAMVAALKGSAARLSYPVANLQTVASRFLLSRDFTIGHEEWRLQRADLDRLPAASLPPAYAFQNLARPAAIDQFRRLYVIAFQGLPWYQPYETAAEVHDELAQAADLLFLSHGSNPVGFAWLRGPAAGVGEVEPLGVAPAERGLGLGRAIMLAALEGLRQRGARRVQVTLWRANEPALALYRSLGFRQVGRRTFLERDLGPAE